MLRSTANCTMLRLVTDCTILTSVRPAFITFPVASTTVPSFAADKYVVFISTETPARVLSSEISASVPIMSTAVLVAPPWRVPSQRHCAAGADVKVY